jgi:hypothetical protein
MGFSAEGDQKTGPVGYTFTAGVHSKGISCLTVTPDHIIIAQKSPVRIIVIDAQDLIDAGANIG